MVYTEYGNTGIKLSQLGFGAMRLPMVKVNDQDDIDYDKAIEMIHRAFELGVNYIDTAPYYCNKLSEVAVGRALKGYRDKVYLSTKNPIEDDSYDHWMERLESSLKKLDTDYIDFYHMWGIGLEAFREKINKKGGPIDAALKAKEQGLIKHLSFSYHDKPENFFEIVDSGYFESILIQYNLLDRSNEKCIAYAHEKGLGVAVMGPVAGGRLGGKSKAIDELMKGQAKTNAETAMRFVLSNPNVNVALSGMSSIEMVEENAAIAAMPTHMTEEVKSAALAMMEKYKNLADLYCTGCKYCLPCPQEVDIPRVFEYANYYKVYDLPDYAKSSYKNFTNQWQKGLDASHCIECGQCEAKCPQKLEIVKQLKESHDLLMA